MSVVRLRVALVLWWAWALTTDSFISPAHRIAYNRHWRLNCHSSIVSSLPAIDKYPTTPEVGKEMMSDLPLVLKIDPFQLVNQDIETISKKVTENLQNEVPILTAAANHFFVDLQGKRFRPTLVVLLGQVLTPNLGGYCNNTTRGKHYQLAELVEMIHVASLIHDDVVDGADCRRGGPTVHKKFGNKVAVLAGDFLLARASVLLGGLQHPRVVQVISSALDSLVQGELMQVAGNVPSNNKESLLARYLRKSFMKTGSLICNACKATSLLSEFNEASPEAIACEQFGFHLGMAFQITDDIIDFCGAADAAGKPTQADLQLGLATAPIIFASEQQPSLLSLIERRFKEPGDVAQAVALAHSTDCLEKSKVLANFHARSAIDALRKLPSSTSRSALENLVHLAVERNK